MKYNIILFAAITLVLTACSKGSGGSGGSGGGNPPPLDCSTVPKSFSTNVNPIIQSVCNTVDCHNSGSTNGPGPLTNYNEVFNARVQVKQAISSGFMPRNTTLSTAQRNSIICWIDSGAPNN